MSRTPAAVVNSINPTLYIAFELGINDVLPMGPNEYERLELLLSPGNC